MQSRPHRVTVYREIIYLFDTLNVSYNDIPTANLSTVKRRDIYTLLTSWSETLGAQWITSLEGVELKYQEDKLKYSYATEISIYCDLTDKQYSEFLLRGLYIE